MRIVLVIAVFFGLGITLANMGRGGEVTGPVSLLLNTPVAMEKWPDSAMYARVDTQTLRELNYVAQQKQHEVQRTVFSLQQLADMAGVPNKEKARLGIDTTPGSKQTRLQRPQDSTASKGAVQTENLKVNSEKSKDKGIQNPQQFAQALEKARSDMDLLQKVVVLPGEKKMTQVLERIYGSWAGDIPESTTKFALAELNPKINLQELEAGQILRLP